ncbi:hypothetical protein [Sphingobacterium faecale]|uniref:Uncharacterized protein n=1 Tax=Sphingobacterium faecale TaxID=2803775 RepID=A0ABS1R526_9SPHI|nr:hypothetical protein [Sphingobacterium faecale]MBL1409797.1 hypothetical protein [Sphingobacterium faecale]
MQHGYISKLKRLIFLPEVAEELHQNIFMAIWNERGTLPIAIINKLNYE